jgi:serine O-acetyltransferase
MSSKDLYTRLLYARQSPLFGRLAYYSLKLLGVEVPLGVEIGEHVVLQHGGFGLVVHPDCQIGSYVKIYPGVTIGRADIYRPIEDSAFEGIVIEDNVILAPGSKVLCKQGILRVGKGTVLGANAVLTESTGQNEIWAGIPASRIGERRA